MTRQHLSTFLFGLFSGLLAAGLILLFTTRQQRHPVRLLPPPSPSPLLVHVTGAVHHPGVYLLPIDSIWETALQAAGGELPIADLERVNLATPIEDGQRIFIPYHVLDTPLVSHSNEPFANGSRININLATLAELEGLPGIGPSLAKSILAYRDEHGFFLEVEDLIKVSGIGPAKLDQIKDLVICH